MFTRHDLLGAGLAPREITVEVRAGRIVRARNGEYLHPDADQDCVDACRAGGRLACVSELARWGVFVLDRSTLHLRCDRGDGRFRELPRSVRRHRSRQGRKDSRDASVDIRQAFIDAVRCQGPRAAVATLDSGLHERLIDEIDLDAIFAALPRRYGVLRRLLDPRADSGPESLVRLLLRTLGCSFDVQVRIDGVGVVDFLVEGWLIIECDSEAFHGTWEHRRRDLRRDQHAAALGLVTYRPIAEDILWHHDDVLAAIRGLLRHRR
ncbi:endonuclease domain-containing protein [Microbacterium sp. GXF7504]